MNTPNISIFFVLNGLVNGEDGNYAIPCGGGDDPRLEDGWYFLPDDGSTDDGYGPFDSKDEALKESENYIPRATLDNVEQMMENELAEVVEAAIRAVKEAGSYKVHPNRLRKLVKESFENFIEHRLDDILGK